MNARVTLYEDMLDDVGREYALDEYRMVYVGVDAPHEEYPVCETDRIDCHGIATVRLSLDWRCPDPPDASRTTLTLCRCCADRIIEETRRQVYCARDVEIEAKYPA